MQDLVRCRTFLAGILCLLLGLLSCPARSEPLGLSATVSPALASPAEGAIKLVGTTAMAGEGKDYKLLAPGEKVTVVSITGPAVIHRIWSTSSLTDKTKLTMKLDGKDQVLWSAAKLPEGQAAGDPLRAMDGQAYWSYLPVKVGQKAEFIAQDLREKSGSEPATEDNGNKFYVQVGFTQGETGMAPASLVEKLRATLTQVLTDPTKMPALAAEPTGGQAPKLDTFALELGKPLKLTDGPNWVVRELCLDTTGATFEQLAATRLILRSDGSRDACVDVPLPYLFGAFWAATEYKGFYTAIQQGKYFLRLPIPEGQGLEFELQPYQKGSPLKSAKLTLSREYVSQAPAYRFCAEYRALMSQAGQPLCLADLQGEGVFVGSLFAADGCSHRTLTFLEGNEQIYVDGAEKPSWEGTGSEDYFNAAWFFSAGVNARVFHGLTEMLQGPPPRISAYRFLIPDRISFTKSLRFDMQHGSRNTSPDTLYKCVSLWYQKTPCKVLEPREAAAAASGATTPQGPAAGQQGDQESPGIDPLTPILLGVVVLLAILAGIRYLRRSR